MTDAHKTRFDAEAAAWDQNPDVHLASKNALKAILKAHPRLEAEEKDVDVIEIGCGTGLLTIPLASYARSILAIDASAGMISALNTKLTSSTTSPTNIQTLCILLVDPEDPQLPTSQPASSSSLPTGTRKKFDLAISHLTLHHIPDMREFLKTVYGTLRPGKGEVLVTDFEDFGADARRFHPKAKMGGVERDGIQKSEIEGVLKDVGFVDVKVEVRWRQWKDVERFDGEWGAEGTKPEGPERMEFPFLVMRGRRGN